MSVKIPAIQYNIFTCQTVELQEFLTKCNDYEKTKQRVKITLHHAVTVFRISNYPVRVSDPLQPNQVYLVILELTQVVYKYNSNLTEKSATEIFASYNLRDRT